MNEKHLALCGSDEWAAVIEQFVVPWVLDGVVLGQDVLEIGPGPGRTTDVLARLAPALTAVEVDPVLASALAARVPPHVAVLTADATALPLAAARFSAAVSLTMLHHVPSPVLQDRLFAEVARVLRPGGVFAGEDSLDGDEFRELHEDDVCLPVPPASLPARLDHAGFDRIDVDTNDYALRFRAHRPG